MISSTLYSNGKNQFQNSVFSPREWSAPIMVSPKEIRALLDSFALCGRCIKCMRMLGLSYSHTRNRLEEASCQQVPYAEIDPDTRLIRTAVTDTPLLIAFADGDVFEIDTPQKPEFRMSMNCIPWQIGVDMTPPNVDANILFSPCIGQTITAVEMNTYIVEKDPMFYEAFGEPPYQREIVSDITLRLENGVGLQISTSIDYCVATCVNVNNADLEICFSELKQALFNWEDLHNDETTGFEAKSDTLFFGQKGAEYVRQPYMTLTAGHCANSAIRLSVSDFPVLGWCISLATGSWFDKYREYHFSRAKWNRILHKASRLLSAERFDVMFDALIAQQDKEAYMISKLDSSGATIWNDREKYKTQIADLRRWSQLVLKPHDTMDIYGFYAENP